MTAAQVNLLTSSSDFRRLLDECATENKLLMVDFFADWCQPCQRIAPYFQQLSEEFASRDVHFVKVDSNRCQDLCMEEFISAFPTFKLFKRKECLGTVRGADPNKLLQLLNKYATDPAVVELRLCADDQLRMTAAQLLSDCLANLLSTRTVIKTDTEQFRCTTESIPAVMECLSAVGYRRTNSDSLEPPPESAIDKEHVRIILDQLKSLLGTAKPSVKSEPPKQPQQQKPIAVPLRTLPPAEEQFARIATYKTTILRYLDPEAQALADSLIPSDRLLEQAARKAKCTIQEVKPLDFLHQLLRWFKEEFFQWAGDFHCETCGAKMNASNSASPTRTELEGDAHVVELYTCSAGHPVHRFPRYNNPKTLLQTRLGRCGEWANCLTLCLVSVRRPLDIGGGKPWFPACRFVCDWTDHVWCELWLEDPDSGTYRWVHCDPGGEVDQPLLYESGWGKKLTYVFAYTVPPPSFQYDDPQAAQAIDVQDVTWRYTQDFKGLLSRRDRFSEPQLATHLAKVHLRAVSAWTSKDVPSDDNQHPFTMKQIIRELSSFLTPAKPPEQRLPGRKTGPLEWRRARGELGADDAPAEPIWEGDNLLLEPTSEELNKGLFYLRYNSALDIYQRPFAADTSGSNPDSSNKTDQMIKHATETGLFGWRSTVSRWRNIERKVEHDWKMVYLAREEGSPANQEGVLEWRFTLPSDEYEIGKVSLFANLVSHSVDTMAQLILCSEFDTDFPESATPCSSSAPSSAGGVCMFLSPGSDPLFNSTQFEGCKQLSLKGRLWTKANSDGERSSVAWQQAQLFRQKRNDSGIWSLEWKVELVKKQPKPAET